MSAPALRIVCTFQSTPPRREVTGVRGQHVRVVRISIHTSPKGGDAAR